MRGLIDPSKIVSSSRGTTTPQSFSRFLTGSKTNINSAPVGGASNNIVNFSRPEVKPATPNFSSIINNISTKINNSSSEIFSNAQNQVQNINQKVFQTVNNTVDNFIKNFKSESKTLITNTIQNLTKDYQQKIKSREQSQDNTIKTIQTLIQTVQDKIKQKDESQPSNVLKNFQTLYKSTIDFVTFLGDSKTNSKISKSLTSLRKMFDEAFNVSVLIREAIIKIVGQLSNLPNASPAAGDLSLDIDVPGGSLKQSGSSSIGRFARSPMGRRIGMGALGLGVGAGAVATGSLAAKQFQEEKLRSETKVEPTGQMIPDSFIENFGNLIDNFGNSIHKLIEFVKNQSEATPPSSSGGGSPPPPPGTQNPTELSAGQYSQHINEASQITGLPASQIAAMGDIESSFNPQAVSKSGARGIMQFMPETYREQYNKYGRQYNLKDDITDPRTSIILGALYMKQLLEGPAGGNVDTMVRMYNTGPAGSPASAQGQEHVRKFNEVLPRYKSMERPASGSTGTQLNIPSTGTPSVGIASTSRASANATSSSTPQPISASVAQTNPASDVSTALATLSPSSQRNIGNNLSSDSSKNQSSFVAINAPSPEPLVIPSGGSNSGSIGGESNVLDVSGIPSSNSGSPYSLLAILQFNASLV